MVKIDFARWLDEQLRTHNWTRAELARRANISQSALSMVWSGDRQPGNELCNAIAVALHLPPEAVFRAAGLLPQIPAEDAEWEIWRENLRKLDPEVRARFRRQVEAELAYEEEQRRLQEAAKRKKTGPLPNIGGL